jgi:hypothetical protein
MALSIATSDGNFRNTESDPKRQGSRECPKMPHNMAMKPTIYGWRLYCYRNNYSCTQDKHFNKKSFPMLLSRSWELVDQQLELNLRALVFFVNQIVLL